ncbi:hypothetical protein CsSME_00040023 [Camellia sinensis var. sinensis]
MADASNHARFLNPWVLHHQKLGLELKCPLCLNLLNRPTLLPCNHIFCDSCVPRLTHFGSECPVCKQQYSDRDVRPAPYMENLVAIYRSLEATFSASLFQSLTSDAPPIAGAADDLGGGLEAAEEGGDEDTVERQPWRPQMRPDHQDLELESSPSPGRDRECRREDREEAEK